MAGITIQQIKKDLERAAYIDRLLPLVRPPKYRSRPFDIIYTPQEIAFMDRLPIKIIASKEQIDLWDKVVMKWLDLLTPYERNIVWKRAKHIPWKLLCCELGRTRVHLWRIYDRALFKIQKGNVTFR